MVQVYVGGRRLNSEFRTRTLSSNALKRQSPRMQCRGKDDEEGEALHCCLIVVVARSSEIHLKREKKTPESSSAPPFILIVSNSSICHVILNKVISPKISFTLLAVL